MFPKKVLQEFALLTLKVKYIMLVFFFLTLTLNWLHLHCFLVFDNVGELCMLLFLWYGSCHRLAINLSNLDKIVVAL